jgi:hypothetical protein
MDELKKLRDEIDSMIAALGEDSGGVKKYLTRYFALRCKALEFRSQIRDHLLEISNAPAGKDANGDGRG